MINKRGKHSSLTLGQPEAWPTGAEWRRTARRSWGLWGSVWASSPAGGNWRGRGPRGLWQTERISRHGKGSSHRNGYWPGLHSTPPTTADPHCGSAVMWPVGPRSRQWINVHCKLHVPTTAGSKCPFVHSALPDYLLRRAKLWIWNTPPAPAT